MTLSGEWYGSEFQKHNVPIVDTPVPMITDFKDAPENAESPMLVTLLGIVTDVRPLQPENAPPPMLVTLLGIVIDVRPLQPLNASYAMLVTL